jgi:2-methylcitrate dehydratase PrpD
MGRSFELRADSLMASFMFETFYSAPSSGTTLTRRSLLQGAGGLIVAAALPCKTDVSAQIVNRPAADQAVGLVMGKLATYMSEASSRVLPIDVMEKTKHHILDTLAAMVSGSELLPGRAAIRFARAYGGRTIATVVGSQILGGPIEAAMANGMLAHSDETDDSHAPSQSHPGCAIVPAALGVGEQFGIDGMRFLHAVVLGYDIGPRVTMTLGAAAYQSESHRSTHSLAGIFGAAAAAGCAASLNTRQMRWMLDYTAQQSSGIAAWKRDTDHIEKAFVYGGMPARDGVTAALGVQSGWTGVEDILSGSDNFFLAFASQVDPAGLIDQLGERYEVTRTNIKKWTVGSPIQAPLDALENLRKRHPFETEQVRQVIVRIGTGGANTVSNRDMPDVCLQHMIAVMLVDHTVSFRSAHDKQRMQNPAILRQRAKVELVPDQELESHLPRREAIVEVVLSDGTHLKEQVESVRGASDNPMTRAEVITKCRDLMAPIIGEVSCDQLIEKALGLESVKNIRELRPLLQRS